MTSIIVVYFRNLKVLEAYYYRHPKTHLDSPLALTLTTPAIRIETVSC